MLRFVIPCVGFAATLLLTYVAAGDDPAPVDGPVAFRGARILTAVGKPIEKGTLLIKNGKIVAVGSQDEVEIPKQAQVIDVTGKTIIPGLVDTHSHVGIYPKPMVPAHADGNEGSGAVQSGLRAMDAIWPDDPGVRMAVAGGVTTANIMPGSGNVIGGQTLYVKLRGHSVEGMRIKDLKVLGGLKMANGENPKNFNFTRNKQAPTTRMKLAAMQREQFVKAQEYQKKWAAYRKAVAEAKDVPPPEIDLGLESLVEVLERKRTVHFHSHRADDLLTAVRLAEEFGFELVIQHGTEGYRIADELAKRKIPVSLTLVDSPGGKMETAALLEENAAVLDKAGVLLAINTDDFITESRFFLRTGSIAVRGGLSEDAALRAQTLNPAIMLHLDDRIGSLEKGKDADFVILSGSPYSIYTHVQETYIEGLKVFDRGKHKDWTYQAGGFAVTDPERVPKAPPDLKPLPEVKAPAPPKNNLPLKDANAVYAILAGRIHTVGKGTISDGVIIVKDGKIETVAAQKDLKLPLDMPILTAAVVTPGLIDAHTVVPPAGALNLRADQDQDEMSDPNQADLRVLDAFNPNEPLLEFLRMQGVTVIHACPGRQNVIAGQTGIFRTSGPSAEKMTIRFPAALLVNLGEMPKRAYPNKLPTTRMGTAALIRNALAQAQSDARKRAAAKDEDKKPPRNLKLEALLLALDRKAPVVFSGHRVDDLDTALRLAKEFDLRAELDLAAEAYLMADRIADAKTPVIVHPTMQRPAEMETFNAHVCNAAVLADHKIPIAIGTGYEDYVPKTRVVRHEAGMAMVNGLGFDRALCAITLDAAKILGIDDRFGSIEPGKIADLVLYDGDPFEHATHVSQTIQDGRVVFDRTEYLKLPFARRALPLTGAGWGCCCLGAW
jgi:imidazolonepropionase-like amidohydrolase